MFQSSKIRPVYVKTRPVKTENPTSVYKNSTSIKTQAEYVCIARGTQDNSICYCKHKTIIVSWSTINSSTSAYCLRFQQKKCNFHIGKTVEKIVKLFTIVRRGVAPTAPAKEILLMMKSVTELVLTMNSVHLLNQLSHLPRLLEKKTRALDQM